MRQLEISFQYRARYYKLGEITPETRQVWFALHGYGQLAQYFIRKFTALQPHRIAVIAPEGLSRFYLEKLEGGSRKNDRVGATWMTKENRLMDIHNYIQYLNSVYMHEVANMNVPVTVLGFSQGSATASRWVLDNKVRFDRLILWAGVFPADMDFQSGREILNNKDVTVVYGKSDPFLSDQRFTEMKKIREKLGVHVNEILFDGGHDIQQETLLQFI